MAAEMETAAGWSPAAVDGLADGSSSDTQDTAAAAAHREQASPNTPVEWALHYAEAMGWFVFPGRKDGRKGKVPLVKWGRGLDAYDPAADLRAFAATRNADLIRAWWKRWPDAEIGIDTGRSNLIVLDVDVRDGKDGEGQLDFLQVLHDDLPPTLEQRTPSGGRQIVYAADRLCHSFASKEGLDVRSRGGMIFVPSGRGDRTWTGGLTSPVQAPDWLPDAFAPRKPEKTGTDEPGLWTVEDLEEALAQLDVEAFAGNHDLWFSAMCAAHHATNGEGEDAFFDWCAGDGAYADDEAANRYRWHSLNAGKEGGTTYRLLLKLLHDPAHGDLWTGERSADWRPRWERPGHEPENDFDCYEEPEQEVRKTWKFRLLSRADLASLPPPRWLVRELLPENALVGLYGDPGAGKSFVAVDLSLSIAHGFGWHGRNAVAGSVLYIAGEGVAGMNARVRAWEIARRASPSAAGWSVVGEAVNLADPKTAQEFVCEMKERLGPLRLIVVDTLARCAPGADENSAKDMGSFIAGCDALRKATGATVLVVHHSGKDSSRGMRGSTAFLGAVDTTIRVTKDADGRGITMAVEKQKDAEPLPPLRFHMEKIDIGGGPDEIRSSITLSPAVVPVEDEDWGESPEGRVLKLAVTHDGLGKKAFADVVARELAMSTSSAMRLVTDVMVLDEVSATAVHVDGSDYRVWMECEKNGRKVSYRVRAVRA